jgi:ATP-dependent protease ClpP protease subunit
VPAVTELVIAELLYLQYSDPRQPIYVYINSTGTSRADGETVYHVLCDKLIMACVNQSQDLRCSHVLE